MEKVGKLPPPLCPPPTPHPTPMKINDDDDDDDEADKIPTHHLGFCLLGFCPLGFIPTTMAMGIMFMMMTLTK